MRTLTVKIEQFKPERKLIEQMHWNDWDRTIEQVSEEVERYIKEQMNIYRHKFPEATEIRWEFVDVGQGHYVPVPTKRMEVKVMQLKREQLLDVMNRSIELEDWPMLESVAYQLRLMGEHLEKSPAFFELPYAVYEFDWMFNDDVDYSFLEGIND